MIPKSPRRTKPYATLTSRKSMNKRGKSTRSKQRQAWQKEMLETYQHITWCEWLEGCGSTFGLAHAHRTKKINVTTREEWLTVARLCQVHHELLEHGDKQVMWDTITKIVESRGNA